MKTANYVGCLLTGPNYREPRSLNFSKAFNDIKFALDSCVDSITSKTQYSTTSLKDWKMKVLEKVQEKIDILKNSMKFNTAKPTLSDSVVLEYLNQLHRRFVIVTIDKAANNFAFICKKFYVARLLQEVGLNGEGNETYSNVDKEAIDLVSENEKYLEKFGLKLDEKSKSLPIMYMSPKMHKSPIGFRFIVASKVCSTKPLTEVVSRVFKMLFNHVESFHRKSKFYSPFNKFWVVQNSFPVINHLNKINAKRKAKSISTFDFSTLYTSIPHNLLINVLCNIIDFVFQGRAKAKIGFSQTSVYWTNKGTQKRFFNKESLKDAVSFLIGKCYFTIGNLVFKQDIGIPMGIDPAPFWANLFLYFYENKFIQQLVTNKSPRAFMYHSTSRFIDDQCALNDGGDFERSYKDIHPPELELKVDHATLLEIDISVVDGKFVYKLFDKRDKFPFFIVRMPHLSSNIPSSIFYGSSFSEILRIARCSSLVDDFISRTSILLKRMINQGGNTKLLLKQINKACERYPETFHKYGINCKELTHRFNLGK